MGERADTIAASLIELWMEWSELTREAWRRPQDAWTMNLNRWADLARKGSAVGRFVQVRNAKEEGDKGDDARNFRRRDLDAVTFKTGAIGK